VEKVDDDDEEGKNYMLDADGNRVRVKTDTATWEKEQARQKASAAKNEAAAEADKELQERGLECSIDHRLFDVPTKTPCCSKTYCYQCIEDALVNNDLVCPSCGTENVLIDDLRPDNEMALKIKAYRDEKRSEDEAKQAAEAAEAKAKAEALLAEVKKAEEEKAKAEEANKADDADPGDATLKNSDVASVKNDDDIASTVSKTKRRSTSPARSALSIRSTAMQRTGSTESASKKRPAEDELGSDRIPTAPAAMRKQQEQVKQTQEGLLPQFLEDMEKFSQNGMNAFMGSSQPGQGQTTATSMPMMPNPMMAMAAGMNPMMMGMPNMMNMGMMGQMDPNMNMNMGMNNMNNMGYHNNGYNQGYQNNNGNWQQQGYNHWNNNGGRGRGRGYNNHNQYNNGGYQNNYNNQAGPQVAAQVGPQRGGIPQGNFDKDHPNEEEDPYFRQPVNPHRHQQRKRMRPSEYTELGGGK
jgi:protein MPE1